MGDVRVSPTESVMDSSYVGKRSILGSQCELDALFGQLMLSHSRIPTPRACKVPDFKLYMRLKL